MDKLKQVLIVAGTHGNELSGIYLHKLIKEGLYAVDRPTFSASSIIANPEAQKQNIRYIDSDLNREFSASNKVESSNSHESKVANQFIEHHANTSDQLIIDLHNTTSNMGATLILLADSPFYRMMGAYVKQRLPKANILFESRKSWSDQPYLCTASEYGVMIEVGSQAHSSLKYSTLELMKAMCSVVLDYIEKHNLKQLGELNDYDAFYYTEEVKAPVGNDGMREAVVHPTLCGRDFEVLRKGEPLLATLSGHDIYWESDNEVYPHFINESAYSDSNIVMALAEKHTVSVR
ncbi:aspartoacylase [Vibrio mediterranei]|uniref:aspartoacylase n=1 Tax=Vibrio mediterranei TaxID=689 RepID=UPI001EFDB262|nr:aspartoacylase [Vibrio mediterranei]MCG9626622.1 aspartoacylase [Vibrio mediterranei]